MIDLARFGVSKFSDALWKQQGEDILPNSDGYIIPPGSGWQFCWECGQNDPITHQWSQNIPGACPMSTNACLPGQSLGGVMRPLGEAVPATHGEFYWLSNTPANPLESPVKIVQGFFRSSNPLGSTEVPLVGQPQSEGSRFPAVEPWRLAGRKRISPWPQSFISGPAPVPRLATEAGHKYEPPGRGVKERKFRALINGVAAVVVSGITEGADMIKALHGALDKKAIRRDGGDVKGKSPQDQLVEVYKYFQYMDGGKAIWNIIQQQVVDAALGKYGRATAIGVSHAYSTGYMHNRPGGFQVGPWDTVTRLLPKGARTTHDDQNRSNRGMP